eukprot:COSAG02_NODE_2580_length_8493_cov_3.138432_4_plen_136_part_00
MAGGDPNLQHAKGIGINRKTLGWNAAAATFAYGYGTLATLGCKRLEGNNYLLLLKLSAVLLTKACFFADKFVGQDQLIGGTWPGMSAYRTLTVYNHIVPVPVEGVTRSHGAACADNEPAVSCMDWQTGQVNAKYW